eukprot:TRINITY_DN39763_c0_g1_i1.p1 TRINITY_DN39763_c0_g1~~TRINITY_DN39763_c0_g1_i1.p1  ORF type:complete len:610 (-),score=56.12 TRINITY_DN39763_c0_g1_i1:141-1919(-)
MVSSFARACFIHINILVGVKGVCELGSFECSVTDVQLAEEVLLQTTFSVSGVNMTAEAGVPLVNKHDRGNASKAKPMIEFSSHANEPRHPLSVAEAGTLRGDGALFFSQSASTYLFDNAKSSRPPSTLQVVVVVVAIAVAMIGIIFNVASTSRSPTYHAERAVYRLMLPSYLLIFADFLGDGMAQPLLPVLVLQLGGSQRDVGYLVACSTGGSILGSVIFGAISERVGRRPVMLLVMIGLSCTYTWVALAPSLLQLYIARSLAGVMNGSHMLAIAMIADLVGDESIRNKYMPLCSAMMGMGWTLGPCISGLLVAYTSSEQRAMLAAPVICAILFVLSSFILKETREEGNMFGPCLPEVERVRSALSNCDDDKMDDDSDISIPSSVWILSICVILYYGGVFMLDASGSVVWIVLFKWDTDQLASYWTVVGLLEVSTSLFLSRWFLEKFGSAGSIKIAMSLACVGVTSFSFIHSIVPHMALVVCQCMSISLGETCAAALVAEIAPARVRGDCVGIVGGAYGLGCAIACLISGGLIETGVLRQQVGEGSFSSLGFVVGGGMCVLALLVLISMKPVDEVDRPPAEKMLPKALSIKA